jgi:gliding motility-associated lipoprotein GldH
MNRLIAAAFLLVIIYSCDSSRVYEVFEEVPEGWSVGDTAIFDVPLTSPEQSYQFTSQFRCDLTYPYSNLYYYFQVRDEQDSLLSSELLQVELFDPKTGAPLGSGLGDLYHVEDISLSGFNPDQEGTYQVTIIQYMRLDTLRGIDRIGLRVNTQ